MFDGMHNIFKVTTGYNSSYHHRMGRWWRGRLFSLKTLLYFKICIGHNPKWPLWLKNTKQLKLFFVNHDGYNSFVNIKVIKAMRILLLHCSAFRAVTSMLTSMSWLWYLEKFEFMKINKQGIHVCILQSYWRNGLLNILLKLYPWLVVIVEFSFSSLTGIKQEASRLGSSKCAYYSCISFFFSIMQLTRVHFLFMWCTPFGTGLLR